LHFFFQTKTALITTAPMH